MVGRDERSRGTEFLSGSVPAQSPTRGLGAGQQDDVRRARI